MSQQLLTESQEKAKQPIACRKTNPAPVPSFQGGLHPIPQLQRALGNRNVAQLIQAKRLTPEGKIIGLQPKLTVGAADDQYEQEADRVAHQVMNTPDVVAANSMQRAMSPEEDKDKMLQTKPLAVSITPFMQRQMVNNEEPEDKEKPVQAKFLTGTSKESLQRQPETDDKEKEPIQAKSAGAQRAMSPEEDKDKMLQTKPQAASITPFVQRGMANINEPEDKDKPLQAKFLTGTSKEALQRQPEADEKEKEPIQAKSAGSMSDSFDAGDDVETRLSQSKGRGSPLPAPVRTYMEPRFGVDFCHVRVHTGSDAMQMNRNVGAQAFTHGSDIYFGPGHSPANLELTAHELTHVVQQTGGMPLQTKKLDESSTANTDPSIQRICAACSEDKERENGGVSNSLHRTSGNRSVQRENSPVSPILQRQPAQERLQSPRFASSAKLELCFENKARLAENDPDRDAVTRVQQALLDLPGITGKNYDLGPTGADGIYGPKTAAAIRKFKTDENLGSIQFGDVGSGTMHRLDEIFASGPPKPHDMAALTAECGQNEEAGKVVVTGVGFPPGEVDLIVDGTGRNAAIAKDDGTFRSRVPANLEDGPHVVKAVSGSTQVLAAFDTPCGASPGPTPKFDPAMEDTLDAIWLQYQQMFIQQRDALDRLEKDLSKQEQPGNILIDIFAEVTRVGLSVLFGPLGDSLSRKLKDTLKGVDSFDELNDWGIDPVFDEAKDLGKDKIKDRADELQKSGAGPLETFMEGQSETIKSASDAAQEKFLTAGKAKARTKPIKQAQELLKAQKNTKFQAYDKQYHESLQEWVVTQARSVLNRDQPGEPTNIGNLKDKGTVSGLLQLDIDGDTSDKPVKVVGAKIAGLSERVRKMLVRENSSIGALNFPRVASGKVNPGFLGIKLFNSSIKIAENENDNVIDVDSSDGGKQWLQEKAAGENRKIPDFVAKEDPQHGAILVFQEIDRMLLSQVKSDEKLTGV